MMRKIRTGAFAEVVAAVAGLSTVRAIDSGTAMTDFLQRLADTLGLALPPYGMGAVLVLVLYAIQSEIRFGRRARTALAGRADRGSTIAVSLSSFVVIVGFVVAMQPPLLSRFTPRTDLLMLSVRPLLTTPDGDTRCPIGCLKAAVWPSEHRKSAASSL